MTTREAGPLDERAPATRAASVEEQRRGQSRQPPAGGRVPRRVLIAAPQPFFSPRGTPIATNYLIRALRELGAAVDLLTYPIGEEVTIDGVLIRRTANLFGIRSVPVGFSTAKLVLDVPLFYELRRLIRGGAYDAVHAIEEAAFFVAMLARPRHAAFVYDMAASVPDELTRSVPLLNGLLRRLERRVLRRANMVICSTGLGQLVEQRAPGVAYREWYFPAQPPDVPADAVAALRARLGVPDDARVVLYAGTFAGYQATELMLGAVATVLQAVPEAFFVFVGAADDELPRLRRALGVAADSPRVRLAHRVPRAELDAYTALAEILLSCRGGGCNVPLKVFDALSAGKPLIANDVPAHRVLLDRALALLVPSTSRGFADGITRVLRDPDLARLLASNGSRYARENLAWPNFVALIADIYDRALVDFDRRTACADKATPQLDFGY